MTLRWETRQQWGAVPPKNRRYDVKPEGVVVHYPGGGRYTGVPHSDCQARMRMWQRMHMTPRPGNSRGSNDIEYGLVLCEHLHLMEGRVEEDKPDVRVGSNGTRDANYRNSSIQLMRGSNDPAPTSAEIDTLAEAIVWLRKHGGWGPKITGHRDHVSTACPGGTLYSKLDIIRRKVKRIEEKGNDVRAYRDWTGKTETVRDFPADGWLNVPGMGRLEAAPFARADEKHTFYCRFIVDWAEIGDEPLMIKWRWVRDGGTPKDPSDDDPTGHDSRQVVAGPGTSSLPVRGYHDEVGEKGVGGRWQFKVSKPVKLSTRYAKLVAREVDWV